MTVTVENVHAGNVIKPVGVNEPIAQASVNTLTLLANSDMDARIWEALSYTISVITDSVDWTVFGANQSDFSDEVAVQAAASIAAGASGNYSIHVPVFGFYRVKIASTVADTPGTATLVGRVK